MSRSLKFNQQELALFASSIQGRADKEGVLWLREIDGTKVKKKQGYVQRWFTLSGNMLFYSKSDLPDSGVVGLIILERCQVEPDNETGNRNSFKLVFDECEFGYLFAANSARDQDEWTTSLNSCSYEYLRTLFSDLRGQLLHLTGRDPLVEEHPYFNEPIKNVSPVPASAPAYEGNPVFELSLACSSLVGSLGDCVPSAMIVTSVMTPPQAYWIRYAQTEAVEHNCDPQFFTTVVFYMGSVTMATRLKFEVFDVYDRAETKVCPIGAAQCQVMTLLRSPDQSQRLEVQFDGAVCGYLTIRAAKSQDGGSATGGVPPVLRESSQGGLISSGDVSSIGFNYRASMDNVVVRTYQFPESGNPDKFMKVTEVMGEGKFSFSVPMQMLDLYINEENELLAHYNQITGLSQEWEINKQAVMFEHGRLVQNYRESKTGLQAQIEAGLTFKKSTSKGFPELDFVPVNLHIQQMKVVCEESDSRDKMVYSVVTVGCPTAYSLKFKSGGLAKLQSTSGVMGLGGSGDTKASRAKGVINRVETAHASLDAELDQLIVAAESESKSEMTHSVRAIADKVHQIKSFTNTTLVNDSLRVWHNELAEKVIKQADLNASALFHKIEEHVLCVEAKVDGHVSKLVEVKTDISELREAVGHLRTVLHQVLSTLSKALYFIILKESYYIMDKFPIGLKGITHRRDVVFSQALSTVITSFLVKLNQSLAISSFLAQLVEVGFLMHWESLLSTLGDELGMLEDFIIAIHDINNVKFKLTQTESLNDTPVLKGTRYKITVDVPLQRTLFRMLPSAVQEGQEISVCAVLFTQGINEQQSIADRFKDNSYQDQINMKSLQQLTNYYSRYRDHFGSANAQLNRKAIRAGQLLEQLRTQVHSRKIKNVDILSLSQELCRTLDCGRVTSCKSAKDRTAMSVTLEQARILVNELQMDSGSFQHALDTMRSEGTRLRNTEKNVGVPLYAFNSFQVLLLPINYRPPDGTYKKLVT